MDKKTFTDEALETLTKAWTLSNRSLMEARCPSCNGTLHFRSYQTRAADECAFQTAECGQCTLLIRLDK